MQRTVTASEELRERVQRSVEALRETNKNFESAYESYILQYGNDVISVNEPTDLAGTVDPIAIVLGRNCVVYYHDTRKMLTGSLGNLQLIPGIAYIIGRREPQDSKVVIWNPAEESETELEEYNPSASRIPSRVHGAIIVSNETRVNFTDLSSSAGTIIVGDSKKDGPFVRIYDPGSPKFPTIKVDRVNTSRRA